MLKKLIGPILLIAAVAVVYLLILNKPRPETKTELVKAVIPVLVKPIQPENHPLQIKAEGFVESRWQTTLSSEVNGQVTSINDALLQGNSFKKGQVLLTVDPLDYEVQLSRSWANLQAAETELVEQMKQAERAKNDWYKLNPNREPSDFNLRIPQLKAAESNRLAAQQEVKLAQDNLANTQLKAPFNGFVVSRNVDLAEIIQVGTVVAELASQEQLEVTVAMDTQEADLVEAGDYQSIVLTDSNKPDSKWTAANVRFDSFIDTNNRWRSMVIELGAEANKPLVGTFMQVMIETIHQELLLKVPESALSIDGRIWYVANKQTEYFEPEVVYQSAGALFLRPTNQVSYPIDIIIAPPNSLLSGTAVEPNLVESQE